MNKNILLQGIKDYQRFNDYWILHLAKHPETQSCSFRRQEHSNPPTTKPSIWWGGRGLSLRPPPGTSCHGGQEQLSGKGREGRENCLCYLVTDFRERKEGGRESHQFVFPLIYVFIGWCFVCALNWDRTRNLNMCGWCTYQLSNPAGSQWGAGGGGQFLQLEDNNPNSLKDKGVL